MIRRPLASLVLLLALVSAIGLTGCQKAQVAGSADDAPSARLVLDEVTVRGISPLDDAGHDALKASMLAGLDDAIEDNLIAFDPTDAGSHHAKATLTFEFVDVDADSTALHLEWEAAGSDAHGRFAQRTDAWVTLTAAFESEEARERAIEVGTRALGGQIESATRALLSSDDALRPLLESDQQGLLIAAIREVQRRGLEDLAGSLRDLLVHPEKEVVLVALAALGQLGDKQSVGAIRDLVTSPDDEKVRQALFALGSIGGEHALQALQAIAEGHPDPEIRAIATEAFVKAKGH